MTLRYSTALRNNQLDQIENTTGGQPRLRIYTGAAPVDCATAASGTVLVDMTLPVDWMSNAAIGIKSMQGTWTGVGTAGASTGLNAGYFRIWDSTVTTCHLQGTITITGGGGDMTLDNTNIAEAQAVTVSSFAISAGNA